MRFAVHISSQAERDLGEILHFLGDHDAGIALEWLRGFEEVIDTLKEFPHRCVVCVIPDESNPEVRRLFYHRHAIFYVIEGDAVAVAMIHHMSQEPFDLKTLAADVKTVLRLEKVIVLIDEVNAADPNTDMLDGVEAPKEQIYGKRMMAWVERLDPEASDQLKIAARAQHICRWEIPRSDYPEGKAGYYQWRTFLYGYHAEKAGAIMAEVGYDADAIESVRRIMDKKNLGTNPDTQTMEDAAALVFLENHMSEFAERDDMDEAKLIAIVQKTWGKMSERGHQAALQLVLPEHCANLVKKALG